MTARLVCQDVGATSAWISDQWRPALDAGENAPDAGSPEIAPRKNPEGWRPLQAAPVISNTPISSVGPEAVLERAQDSKLMRAFALEVEHRVHHVLDHARARDLAVLGDVADQDDRGPGALGETDQRLRAAARTCVTVPGADSTAPVLANRLDRDR